MCVGACNICYMTPKYSKMITERIYFPTALNLLLMDAVSMFAVGHEHTEFKIASFSS